MTETGPQAASTETEPRPTSSARLVILLAVIAVFAAIVLIKVLAAPDTAPSAPDTAASLTSVHNDAVGDYEAALATGKPIYVLFHSLSCDPCVEISRVADAVLPEYGSEITFVNAITDDPSGQQLSSRFSFQYIPTSFFLKADGTIVDTYTGALTADEMRAYLDTLVAQ
ncbi:MAG TPA: thioredoxin family protein [Coriobacteriia bacterium]|nr:thioredoxin family protein [Coriobacteriia bacterium]